MDFQNNETKGGWLEWAKYVLMTLQQHESDIKEIQKKDLVDNIEFEKFRTKIETKSSMLAIVISALVTIAVNIIVYLIIGK
jgi:hypothetical protein